ncbi:MAG: hypothetical protein AAGA45_02350 [Verrucomicrobiota bacterium]
MGTPGNNGLNADVILESTSGFGGTVQLVLATSLAVEQTLIGNNAPQTYSGMDADAKARLAGLSSQIFALNGGASSGFDGLNVVVLVPEANHYAAFASVLALALVAIRRRH